MWRYHRDQRRPCKTASAAVAINQVHPQERRKFHHLKQWCRPESLIKHFKGFFSMLNFKKLFLGLLFSVLFSFFSHLVCTSQFKARLFAVRAYTRCGCGGDRRRFRFCFRFPCGAPRGGKRLAARPCAWHALCSFLCCDKRYAVCKYAGCTSCYTERNICNMQRMRWSNGCE